MKIWALFKTVLGDCIEKYYGILQSAVYAVDKSNFDITVTLHRWIIQQRIILANKTYALEAVAWLNGRLLNKSLVAI